MGPPVGITIKGTPNSAWKEADLALQFEEVIAGFDKSTKGGWMKSMEFFILHRVVDSSTICSYQLTLGGISLLCLMGPKMLQSLNLNLQSYPDIYMRYFHLSPFYTKVRSLRGEATETGWKIKF